MSECVGPGNTHFRPGRPDSTHCENCPPWRCGQCAVVMTLDRLCGCWRPIGSTFADVKADMASVGLSVAVDNDG